MQKIALFLSAVPKWTPEQKALNKACNDLYNLCSNLLASIHYSKGYKGSKTKIQQINENYGKKIKDEVSTFPDLTHRKKLQSFKDDYKKIMDYLKNTVTFRSYNW